ESLFAAGSDSVAGNNPVIYRWGNSGRGKVETIEIPGQDTSALKPYMKRGVAFAGSGFGLVDDKGNVVSLSQSIQADMRFKIGKIFKISDDAQKIRFGLSRGGENPWLFDLENLKFRPSQTTPAGLEQPDTTSLNIEGWRNKAGRWPKLNGK